MRLYLNGVGLWAPGLTGWSAGRHVLAGREPYRKAPLVRPAPTILPQTERRRSGNTVLLAIQSAQEAMESSGASARDVAAVFASSAGDSEIVHDLCTALAQPERLVSPTRFHNSVHNAAAGYWSIATGSQQAATSLSCYDATFAMGLVESAAQVVGAGRPVLFVAYDWPPPPPLHAKRPLVAAFSVGMMLSAQWTRQSMAVFDIELADSGIDQAGAMDDTELDTLCRGNPAARALPLLAAIARQQAAVVTLDYSEARCVRVVVGSCTATLVAV
jgi:hypothetical protein